MTTQQASANDLIYIVLLQNKYLLFLQSKPQKKGAYLAGVKLFQTAATTAASDINKWVKSKHNHALIEEVEDWA